MAVVWEEEEEEEELIEGGDPPHLITPSMTPTHTQTQTFY